MRYYIIAGEASGDLHASNLIRGLRAEDPEADIRGWGGDLMREAGAEIVRHYKDTAIMGFLTVLKNLGKIKANIRLCCEDIRSWKPDVVILVDYAGFNLRIARFAKGICQPCSVAEASFRSSSALPTLPNSSGRRVLRSITQ